MSFIQKVFSLFVANKITITTVPYINRNNFNNNLKYTFTSGINIKQIMNNLNKYRNPSRQVKACYINGFKVDDDLKITENTVIQIAFQVD
jgi:hypothetical protein